MLHQQAASWKSSHSQHTTFTTASYTLYEVINSSKLACDPGVKYVTHNRNTAPTGVIQLFAHP
jgi:hypothetical protein